MAKWPKQKPIRNIPSIDKYTGVKPKPLYMLVIHYVNGSADRLPFDQFTAVRDFYQHNISYSGDRVRRVEVDMHDGGTRAIWDASWTDESKRAGLQN